MRRVERILYDAAHPGTVWDAHVSTQRGGLIQRHTEQIISLANFEHFDQLWDDPAIRIFSHDDRFTGCEPGDIAIPGWLAIACVAHFSNDEIDLWLHGVIPMRHKVEEVTRNQNGAPFFGGVFTDVIGQLAEVAGNLAGLIAVIFPKERRALALCLEVVSLPQQPFAVMEGLQVGPTQFGRKLLLRQILQILPKTFHTFLAETAAILEAGNRQFSFIQLDAIYPGIDLDADDGFQVFAPNRVVAIHHETLMLPVGSFDPAGIARLPIYVARTACLDQVGHFLALAVDQTHGKILLERRPELRIAILRELTQPHPSPLASAPQFVEGEDLAFVFIQFGLDFPALHLEDDTKHFDALPLT